MTNEIIDTKLIGQVGEHLYKGVSEIIDNAMLQVAVYVNAQSSMTFWNVGKYIIDDMDYQTYSAYGQKILATLSQRLMARYGKGYTYSALTRMMKVARIYSDRVYLKYIQKYDMQPDENPPIGLLLCSEGNTEHIELLMLDEDNIKVGQYTTYLPDKQWFIDKLSRSILIAKEHGTR